MAAEGSAVTGKVPERRNLVSFRGLTLGRFIWLSKPSPSPDLHYYSTTLQTVHELYIWRRREVQRCQKVEIRFPFEAYPGRFIWL